jgi:hypothetical protein
VRPRIGALLVSEQSEEHLARHAVSVTEVEQLLANPHVLLRNRGGRAATLLIVGRTDAGRVLTTAVAPTNVTDAWRLYTAYPSSDRQRELLMRMTRP